MAFHLRIGECWVRCIQETEERKDLKASAPEPATKRRKIVQHSLPEARREKTMHLPQFKQSVYSKQSYYLMIIFYQKSITLLPVKLHWRFYLTDQIAMHEFINKIGELSIYFRK